MERVCRKHNVTSVDQQKVLSSISIIGSGIKGLCKKTHLGALKIKEILRTLEEKGYCKHVNVSTRIKIYYRVGSVCDPLIGLHMLRAGRKYLQSQKHPDCTW